MPIEADTQYFPFWQLQSMWNRSDGMMWSTLHLPLYLSCICLCICICISVLLCILCMQGGRGGFRVGQMWSMLHLLLSPSSSIKSPDRGSLVKESKAQNVPTDSQSAHPSPQKATGERNISEYIINQNLSSWLMSLWQQTVSVWKLIRQSLFNTCNSTQLEINLSKLGSRETPCYNVF